MSFNVLIVLAVIVLAVIIMGVIIMLSSKKAMMAQISHRMLDVVKSASAMIDGDDLENITPNDVGTEKYERAMNVLKTFDESIDLAYIYALREEDDGSFVYTLDPSDDPAPFGSKIEMTDALKAAGDGRAKADKKALSDRWGRFYSAYSPVFNSEGRVVAVVGVDFAVEWYDDQLSKQRILILASALVACLIGIIVSWLISLNEKKKYKVLYTNMQKLDEGFEKLHNKVMVSSIDKLNLLPENSRKNSLKKLSAGGAMVNVNRNEISEIDFNMRTLNEDLEHYIEYIDSQTYIDQFTRTGNKAAYQNAKKNISKTIDNKNAKFGVGFFDISKMKETNTQYGFEAGDRLIFDTAAILKNIFGSKNVFHITSDEFIVVIEGTNYYDMRRLIVKFDEEVKEYNDKKQSPPELSVVRGFDAFQEGVDEDYKSVFMKAAASAEKYRESVISKKEKDRMLNYYY